MTPAGCVGYGSPQHRLPGAERRGPHPPQGRCEIVILELTQGVFFWMIDHADPRQVTTQNEARCVVGFSGEGHRYVAGFFRTRCEMNDPRLRWIGNQEAQKEADEAFAKLRDKPKKKKRSTEARRRKQRLRNEKRGRVQYREYIPSKKWKRKRKKAFEHYGRVCAICGATDVMLYVHHRTYRNLGHEPMEDLQILCLHCHEDQHEDKVLATDHASKQFRDLVAIA